MSNTNTKGKILILKQATDVIEQWSYSNGNNANLIHTHAELLKLFNMKNVTAQYYKWIAEVNKLLKKRGVKKYLKSQVGIGYKILMPDEYISASWDIMKQGRNKFVKAETLLEDAPIVNMSVEARNVRTKMLDKIQIDIKPSIEKAMGNNSNIGEIKTELQKYKNRFQIRNGERIIVK